MPDESTTPPVTTTTTAPVTTPVAPPPEQSVTLSSKQLQDRLAEANGSGQRAALKALGFEKPEDAQAALKKLKELEDASKTELEKRDQRIKELEPQATQAVSLKATLDGLVADQFATLPEAVQKAVDGVAKGDSAKRIEQIKMLRESGLLPAVPVAAVTTTSTTTTEATPPITTAPSPAPPPSGAPTAYQKWQDMQKTSPMMADIFFNTNQREIERTRPASATA